VTDIAHTWPWCLRGKGRLHFVYKKAKCRRSAVRVDCRLQASARHWVLVNKMTETNIVCIAQHWLRQTDWCSMTMASWFEYNSSILGATTEKYYKLHPKWTATAEMKVELRPIWNNLAQKPIDRSIMNSRKRLLEHVNANGGHSEQSFLTLVHQFMTLRCKKVS